MVDFLELAKKQRREVKMNAESSPKKEIVAELVFEDKKPKKKEPKKVIEIETPPKIKKETTAIVQTSPMKHEIYTISKADVKAHLDMYNFVKSQIVNESDFAVVKGKKFLKKSGVRKFINAFGISIELIEKRIFEMNGDIHAEVRVRAITQKGQSVEGIGLKSMSELYEKSLHNLVTTAWTRAVNRAILDLVAYGEVSAEELATDSKDKEDWF